MIAIDQNIRSTAHRLQSTSRRARALVPDLCRGLGIALGAVVVLSLLAVMALEPFMHA